MGQIEDERIGVLLELSFNKWWYKVSVGIKNKKIESAWNLWIKA